MPGQTWFRCLTSQPVTGTGESSIRLVSLTRLIALDNGHYRGLHSEILAENKTRQERKSSGALEVGVTARLENAEVLRRFQVPEKTDR